MHGILGYSKNGAIKFLVSMNFDEKKLGKENKKLLLEENFMLRFIEMIFFWFCRASGKRYLCLGLKLQFKKHIGDNVLNPVCGADLKIRIQVFSWYVPHYRASIQV